MPSEEVTDHEASFLSYSERITASQLARIRAASEDGERKSVRRSRLHKVTIGPGTIHLDEMIRKVRGHA